MTLSRLLSVGSAAALTCLSVSARAQNDTPSMHSPAATAQQPAPSPRDSVKVTIAGADLSVNYGRPSKRGREIFGGLKDMKWGMVWRMGANEATAFTTSKALSFGDKTVPAGKYTLYVLLDQAGKWELIVNKQTGQWGTVYDQAQDLVRIPMTVTALPSVVEKMEITVKAAGKGGVIATSWDKTSASAAFTVK